MKKWIGTSVVLMAAAIVAFGATASAQKKPAPTHKASVKQWQQIVARAKQEGSVTIYSTQVPTRLAAFAAVFKAKYGIDVTINRQIDSVAAVQVGAEHATGNVRVDMWVTSSKGLAYGSIKNGWLVHPVGPNFYAKRYDRKAYLRPGAAFLVGGGGLGFAWNTRLQPQGMTSERTVLDPSLANGRVGIFQQTTAATMDYFLWLEETYGNQFLERLAAQKPKIYPNAIGVQQAIISGEVAVGICVSSGLNDSKAQGAPVEFRFPRAPWAPPFYGLIFKRAPHPNAAQLLADFMVTPEGQASVAQGFVSVLKNVPGTVSTKIRDQPFAEFTPAKVDAFTKQWNALFGR